MQSTCNYTNVMEELVSKELTQQLQFYPEPVRERIDRDGVSAFALNRLPALYARTQRGQRYQSASGRIEYRFRIQAVVREGIKALRNHR